MRFNVELFLSAGVVFALDNHIGLGPSIVYVAFIHHKGLEDVIVAPDDLLFRKCIIHIEDRRQRLDIECDGTARLFKKLLVRVRQQYHRLFCVVEHSFGKTGLIVGDERDAIPSRNIGGGDDRELIPGNIGSEVDFADATASDGTAHRCTMQHARKCEVINVTRLPGDFAAPLGAR